MNNHEQTELLYRALNSECGIAVRTDNPDKLRQQLYRARKQDEDLACLTLAASRTDPENELWIVKR